MPITCTVIFGPHLSWNVGTSSLKCGDLSTGYSTIRPSFAASSTRRGSKKATSKEGPVVEYTVDKSPHFKELVPTFQDKWGPKITVQVIGIGYNPNKIKTPPKSWDELWDPKYKGRVGLTAMNSQLGIAFLAELNRVKGGSETDFEPALDRKST